MPKHIIFFLAEMTTVFVKSGKHCITFEKKNNYTLEWCLHMNTYGQRVFAAAAPTLWNNLPICIRNAKTVLLNS